GGILQYSTNNGGSWSNAAPLLNQGQNYNGTISSDDGNPLAGQAAFTGDSHGYVSSRYNLHSLAGQHVRCRWRIGTDGLFGGFGWVIDDIKIYTCGTATAGVETLVNGGFETAGDTNKLAAAWTAKNLTTNDKRKCNKDGKPPVAQQGTCAFQLKGDA